MPNITKIICHQPSHSQCLLTVADNLCDVRHRPKIECFPNQYKNYAINISFPEFTSVCPKTGLPDFGTLNIRYMPDKLCLELKSLKFYLLAYRNLGIFYENAVNRILEDVRRACRPKWMEICGDFNPRGGMKTQVVVRYSPRKR